MWSVAVPYTHLDVYKRQPVPWSHEPNRGVLRALYALRRAADSIGEDAETERLTEFLHGADPTAIAAIEAGE